jgi:hypothetical protein
MRNGFLQEEGLVLVLKRLGGRGAMCCDRVTPGISRDRALVGNFADWCVLHEYYTRDDE